MGSEMCIRDRAWADTSQVKVNEAITLNIELRGTGNINMFSLPEINFPGDMDVFPPTSSFEKEKLWDQYTGTMRWQYILIPRNAGQYQLPRVQISYFNPKDKSWSNTGTKPIGLIILPGETDFVGSTSGFTKEEISLLGSDIRYNITETPVWILRDQSKIPIWVWTSYVLAALLFVADHFKMKISSLKDMSYVQAFIIGMFQVLAFIPGASRAGVTITGARFLGFDRSSAAIFSMLLSIPIILASLVLTSLDFISSSEININLYHSLFAAIVACITALVSINIMMRIIQSSTFNIFIIYRVLLGFILLYFYA